MSAQTLSKIYKTAHVFGLSAVLLMFLWMNSNDKGFTTKDHFEFNLHPLCMALALLFTNGEAVMAFRSLRAYPRHLIKLFHAVLHGSGVLIIGVGIKAVRDSEDYHVDKEGNLSPLPRSHALHAWMGSTIATVYFLQWFGSLILFYFPLTPGHVRATALPYHRIGGIVSFIFAGITIALGVRDRHSWGLNCSPTATICLESWFIILFAVSVFLYASCVLSIVLYPAWSTKIPLSKLNEQKKVR